MLFAFGSNGSGQLGIGHEDDASLPKECVVPSAFGTPSHIRIAAGGNHTLVLASSEPGAGGPPSYTFYACGENTDGRCGLASSVSRTNIFQRAEVCSSTGAQLQNIKLCSATWEASIFVTSDDRVFTCGTGLKGELGLGEAITQSLSLQQIPNFPPAGLRIADLASSMGHTVAVLSNGDVYGWGQGRKGQLGQPAGICWEPRKISGVGFKAVRAVCGKEFSYIVGPSEQGAHVILGSDKWAVRSAAPGNVVGWRRIGASWNGIYVLLQSGALVGWGRNDHGQLPPANLPPVEDFAAGSEHVLAKTKDGKVLGWGWGEHGNCGTPAEAGGDVAGRWNEIDVEGPVVGIGAGCATSWIFVAGP